MAGLDIGSRLELFVDEELIGKKRNVALKMHEPVPQEICLRFNKSWEGSTSYYVTVLQDGDLYRMYYRGSGAKAEGDSQYGCCAESADGKNWVRTSVGLHEHNASKDNNIVWTGFGGHNFAPFIDENPACKPSQRYKALAGGPLIGLVSADGVEWKKLRKAPVITDGAFDSQNVAMWDTVQKQYVAYFRVFADVKTGKMSHELGRDKVFQGVRSIARATSDDFRNWSETVEIDYGDTPREQLYTNAIVACPRAPHIHLGFPKRFMTTRKANPEHPHIGVSDGVLMTSRDGVHWDRRFMEAFLRPGRDPRNWGERSNHIARGILQTAPDELSIYYIEHYRTRTCRLRRATVRTDGFISVNAPYSGGEFTTVPLKFSGNRLIINYATSAAGSVRVELRDKQGKPIAGYTLRECPEIYGDEIEHTVTWGGGDDLSKLQKRGVQVRFVMKDADLYSVRFVD